MADTSTTSTTWGNAAQKVVRRLFGGSGNAETHELEKLLKFAYDTTESQDIATRIIDASRFIQDTDRASGTKDPKKRNRLLLKMVETLLSYGTNADGLVATILAERADFTQLEYIKRTFGPRVYQYVYNSLKLSQLPVQLPGVITGFDGREITQSQQEWGRRLIQIAISCVPDDGIASLIRMNIYLTRRRAEIETIKGDPLRKTKILQQIDHLYVPLTAALENTEMAGWLAFRRVRRAFENLRLEIADPTAYQRAQTRQNIHTAAFLKWYKATYPYDHTLTDKDHLEDALKKLKDLILACLPPHLRKLCKIDARIKDPYSIDQQIKVKGENANLSDMIGCKIVCTISQDLIACDDERKALSQDDQARRSHILGAKYSQEIMNCLGQYITFDGTRQKHFWDDPAQYCASHETSTALTIKAAEEILHIVTSDPSDPRLQIGYVEIQATSVSADENNTIGTAAHSFRKGYASIMAVGKAIVQEVLGLNTRYIRVIDAASNQMYKLAEGATVADFAAVRDPKYPEWAFQLDTAQRTSFGSRIAETLTLTTPLQDGDQIEINYDPLRIYDLRHRWNIVHACKDPEVRANLEMVHYHMCDADIMPGQGSPSTLSPSPATPKAGSAAAVPFLPVPSQS